MWALSSKPCVLLAAGARPDGLPGSPHLPLASAVAVLHLRRAVCLLRAGADPRRTDPSCGGTPLDCALRACASRCAMERASRAAHAQDGAHVTDEHARTLVAALLAGGGDCAVTDSERPPCFAVPGLLEMLGWVAGPWSPEMHCQRSPVFPGARARGAAGHAWTRRGAAACDPAPGNLCAHPAARGLRIMGPLHSIGATELLDQINSLPSVIAENPGQGKGYPLTAAALRPAGPPAA